MPEFVRVGNATDVPPGARLYVDFEEESVIVLNVDGAYYCVADLCSHDDGPLEDGKLAGFDIECPRHGARFDVRTGKALCLPATKAIPNFAVKIENGEIFVEAPDEY